MAPQYERAAARLHAYLIERHWSARGLTGPDPGIRFNYRIGRFLKSYCSRLPWCDDYYYLQAQGYWVLGNWLLFDRTRNPAFRELAIAGSRRMLETQGADGAWSYPNPEWQGRVATAEGTWGAIGLLETFARTADESFLAGALAWTRYLRERIGFQQSGDGLAVNYFAGRECPRVPNNSAFVLRYLAKLAALTGSDYDRETCAGLLRFLRSVQQESGEFPYAVAGVRGGGERSHFQCYQYNAFQCLDLIAYFRISNDASALPPVRNVLRFLRAGLAEDGHALYECGNPIRAVAYHTAALAAAFAQAGFVRIDGYGPLARKAYAHLLEWQRPDGGFPHSRGDYRLLRDDRSYPRYLAMILYHLLLAGAALERPHRVTDQIGSTTETCRSR